MNCGELKILESGCIRKINFTLSLLLEIYLTNCSISAIIRTQPHPVLPSTFTRVTPASPILLHILVVLMINFVMYGQVCWMTADRLRILRSQLATTPLA